MTVAPIIKKVPGAPVKFEHEKDGYVNLSLMNKTELLDLLERENKILNNKKFVDKLPDKGGKIKDFRDKVENELKRRNEQDKLCHLLSNLDVSDSKEALNKLEWTGDTNSPAQNEVKCDTENETDPLRIIATHSGTTISREKVLKIEEPLSLIKPSDTEDAHTIMTSVDLYAKQLCEKFDKTQEVERKKFYPNKTLNKTFTRTMSHRKEPEISSAYVPKSISGQAKLISLEESITVHQEQMKHLKEVEMQHAIERLIKKAEIKMKQPKNLINAYREQHNEDSEDEESDVFEENSEEENEKESISNLSDVD